MSRSGNRETEQERILRLLATDMEYAKDGALPAGMDEVGRGPLAGPVVVCCVVMPTNPLVHYVNDSKKIAEHRRSLLYDELTLASLDYAAGWVWPNVIDEINILQATKRAFCEAFAAMKLPIDDVMIDALTGLDISARQHSLIHGDARSYSIACASIIAKVTRDRYMQEQDKLYPQYGFASNKGYGTVQHIAALREYGPCPIHRMSFIGKFI